MKRKIIRIKFTPNNKDNNIKWMATNDELKNQKQKKIMKKIQEKYAFAIHHSHIYNIHMWMKNNAKNPKRISKR